MAISISLPSPAHQQLGQLVQLHARPRTSAVEHLLDRGSSGPSAFLSPSPERLEVEEVEVEDPVEGREVARLLDERGGERGLERLAVLCANG